jgi:hypothetical protein
VTIIQCENIFNMNLVKLKHVFQIYVTFHILIDQVKKKFDIIIKLLIFGIEVVNFCSHFIFLFYFIVCLKLLNLFFHFFLLLVYLKLIKLFSSL